MKTTRSSKPQAGLTLVEMVVALAVLSLLMVGILSALIFAHRSALESICSNASYSASRGCLEQVLRGVSFNDMPYTDSSNNLYLGDGTPVDASDAAFEAKRGIQVQVGQASPVTMKVALCSLPNLASITPGSTAPSGVVETTVSLDVRNTPDLASDDVELRIWLWIKDASVPAVDATQVRALHLVYHWRFNDGQGTRWHSGVIRAMRSSAPTF